MYRHSLTRYSKYFLKSINIFINSERMRNGKIKPVHIILISTPLLLLKSQNKWVLKNSMMLILLILFILNINRKQNR